MTTDYIGYEALARRALRTVVRDALKRVEAQGLIGSHHFYLTFRTHDPGVDIPDHLKERFPDEMTIVIQNQYWGLKVTDEYFEVTLTFQKLPADLHIPFEALTAFADPGAQFGLQFRDGPTTPQKEFGAPAPREQISKSVPTPLLQRKAQAESDERPAGAKDATSVPSPAPQVVSLDKFRKK